MSIQRSLAGQVLPPIKPGTLHEAYPVYAALPLGHTLHKLPDDFMHPHVEAKAVVVVDCMDREIVFGEHFLILQSDGPRVWQFLRPQRAHDRPTVYLRIAGWDPVINRMGFWSDGEIYRDALEQKIIGRVVGIFKPPARQ